MGFIQGESHLLMTEMTPYDRRYYERDNRVYGPLYGHPVENLLQFTVLLNGLSLLPRLSGGRRVFQLRDRIRRREV